MKKSEILIKNCKIPLLYEFDNSLPVVKFKLVFCASGAACAKFGLANLVSEMLNEGTLQTSKNDFASLLETRAISLASSCGMETFAFEIRALKEHFGYALARLDELIKAPNFTQKTLEKVKTQIKAEILDNQNDFDSEASRILAAISYPNSPLCKPIIGDKKSIDEISLQDVKDFFAGLNLSNLYVFLGGECEVPDLSEILSNFDVGEKRNLPKISPLQNAKKCVKMESEQAYIYFNAPYKVAESEKYLAKVAMFILGGGGFGSRIMEIVRVQNGLAYSAYSRAKFSKISSEFSGYLQTKNENATKALSLVKSVIAEFVSTGATAEELKAAKDFLLGSTPLRKETAFKRMDIAEDEFYNDKEFGEFDKELERIKALNLEDLNSFIKAHTEINQINVAVVSKLDEI